MSEYLLIMRHANNAGDNLTSLGKKQARAMAEAIEAAHFLPETVLYSPSPRAQETALILTQAFRLAAPARIEASDLLHEDNAKFTVEALKSFNDKARVKLVVTHYPNSRNLVEHAEGRTFTEMLPTPGQIFVLEKKAPTWEQPPDKEKNLFAARFVTSLRPPTGL